MGRGLGGYLMAMGEIVEGSDGVTGIKPLFKYWIDVVKHRE